MGVEGSNYLVRVKMFFWRWRWQAAETRLAWLSLVPRERPHGHGGGLSDGCGEQRADCHGSTVRTYQVGIVREYYHAVFHFMTRLFRSLIVSAGCKGHVYPGHFREVRLPSAGSFLCSSPLSVQLEKKGGAVDMIMA